ncbi:MAG TPA: 16S rRNA (adenine(1518)-N(6)/adenine(1519)-N(6))-dimethyltransferase RsmA [Rhodomicrobium sp.]|nr:16S rRNA (adenine(1518)-N(6)/adenine(1519)-N(6))-dimethyltransferase RsmA [Rhodomicrobium sp.]
MSLADSIASLPPLREVIKEAALSARKSLGQNFILDLNVTRRIARSAGPLDNVTVLEIGPGPGGLTRALFLEGAARVVAIERDERFKPALSQIEERSGGRFRLLFMDALDADYGAIAAETGASRIVANLPYNIATPVIVAWLSEERWPPWFDKVVVMVQREVADRLVAEPGGADYGRLTVLAQHRARARLLFTLPPTVFTPPPKVSSALVEITPIAQPPDAVPVSILSEVTAAAFGQRRKMLRSSLSALGADTPALLRDANLDPSLRAERLTVCDFLRLARCLQHRRQERPAGRRT